MRKPVNQTRRLADTRAQAAEVARLLADVTRAAAKPKAPGRPAGRSGPPPARPIRL